MVCRSACLAECQCSLTRRKRDLRQPVLSPRVTASDLFVWCSLKCSPTTAPPTQGPLPLASHKVSSVTFSSNGNNVLCGDESCKLTLLEALSGQIMWHREMSGEVRTKSALFNGYAVATHSLLDAVRMAAAARCCVPPLILQRQYPQRVRTTTAAASLVSAAPSAIDEGAG